MDSKGLITELPVEAQIKFVKGLFFFFNYRTSQAQAVQDVEIAHNSAGVKF